MDTSPPPPPPPQCLVRDLDLTLQPRIAPRYKTWLPLATQQLRLRSLVRVVGFNLEADKKQDARWFYYTLHRSGVSCPFYTSEAIDDVCARWASLEAPTIHATGLSAASEIVLRLWRRTTSDDPTSDATVFTWGISLSGLTYLGPKLPSSYLERILRDNSMIFQLHGGYFAPSYCLTGRVDNRRYLRMSVAPTEVRASYTVVKLTSLKSKMQALKQQTESLRSLRDRIASGDNFQSHASKQTSLNRLLQPKKLSREKKAEMLRIRKQLEIAKFRTKLLEQERMRKMVELRSLNRLHIIIMEENQDHGSDLMSRYRELNKDMERMREWRQSHMETREAYAQTSSKLAHRRRQLISELSLIYPVSQEKERKFTINNVHLPDSEDLETANDTQVAVGLGFVAHSTQMIANFLNIPTRYPILHYGSRSRVIDHITDSLPDNERQFPLFARSKDKLQFNYAVYLLNKNIAQLRWYCGLPTSDLRPTLPNLASLIINIRPNQPLDSSKRTFSGSSLDTDIIGNGRQNNAPALTPPIPKGYFEKYRRGVEEQDIGQLRSVKSGLCSSLDQGLDEPLSSLLLTKKSKRIYKSEESAMDDKNVSLARVMSSSSEETLDDTVFLNENAPPMSRDKFIKMRNVEGGIVDGDIEILTPVSVSKRKTCSTDDSGSIKQRNSNSISSCEMALSSSQYDIGESSPNSGNSSNGGGCSKATLNDEIAPEESETEPLINKNYDGKSLSSSDNTANNDLLYDRDKTLADHLTEKKLSVASKNSVNSEDTLSYSCASLDDNAHRSNYNYHDDDDGQVPGPSSSSCPQIRDSSPLHFRGYDSDERLDKNLESRDELQDGLLPRGESSASSEGPSELSQLLDENRQSPKLFSHDRSNKNRDVAIEYRASTDYFDSMRRSSENVFARTEALASQKTSFKVMKPRM